MLYVRKIHAFFCTRTLIYLFIRNIYYRFIFTYKFHATSLEIYSRYHKHLYYVALKSHLATWNVWIVYMSFIQRSDVIWAMWVIIQSESNGIINESISLWPWLFATKRLLIPIFRNCSKSVKQMVDLIIDVKRWYPLGPLSKNKSNICRAKLPRSVWKAIMINALIDCTLLTHRKWPGKGNWPFLTYIKPFGANIALLRVTSANTKIADGLVPSFASSLVTVIWTMQQKQAIAFKGEGFQLPPSQCWNIIASTNVYLKLNPAWHALTEWTGGRFISRGR